ncbi:isochorismate synthase MenF [Rhodococcus sp. NPDC058521]|uniref:isochorismate synthase n=1 Tax=Rhodococcus sp. NPDC058521 TaxID=3346536 RepID=UPI00364A01A8
MSTPAVSSALPRFVLTRPELVVESFGARNTFKDPRVAAAALRRGEASSLVGALPFDTAEPCSLTEPDELRKSTPPWQLPESGVNTKSPGLGSVSPAVFEPDDDTHAKRVAEALGVIDSGKLEKIVLSRKAQVTATAPFDPHAVLGRLVRADANGNGYLTQLDDGATLVGSSPEVLIRRRGTTVTCHPLAGSARREPDPVRDDAVGRELLASTKDLHEHAFVIDSLRHALAPLCSELDVPAGPELTGTPQLWHLGTPITGTLNDPSITALDLALAVHPTPAVNGTPADAAMDFLRGIEPDRGFYAGTVGWCDGDGDGEWMVAIRCARISPDRHAATAYAGGGIVAGSDPSREVSETLTKFRTVLAALGSDSADLEW